MTDINLLPGFGMWRPLKHESKHYHYHTENYPASVPQKYTKRQIPLKEKSWMFLEQLSGPLCSVIVPLKLFDRADPNHLAIIR